MADKVEAASLVMFLVCTVWCGIVVYLVHTRRDS